MDERTGTEEAVVEANPIEIAEALADIRDLQDETGRITFVHAIGEALGGPLFVNSHPSAKLFLYNLVIACRDRVGGVDAMLRVVDFLAGDTHAAALVRRLASPVQDLLEPDSEVRIKELLQGLTVPALPRIYYAASGDAVSPPPRRLGDAWEAFCILLDANTRPDGVPPHLLFIGLLIRVLEREAAARSPRAEVAAWLSDRLRDWLVEQQAVLRAEDGESAAERLDQIRAEKELQVVEADLPIHLIIQLVPVDGPSASDVRISHWRQIDPFEWRPLRCEDRIVAREQVAEQVGNLIQEAEGGWAHQLDDSLVLEFVLPMGLLHLAPDEWTRYPPGEPYPTPLGMEYEVIIRSYERMYDRTMHRAWRQRWKVLCEAAECLVHWPDTEGETDLYQFRNDLLGERNVVAAVLSSSPDREPGRTQLRMALRAGVPVLLWDRGTMSMEKPRDMISDVIERPDMRTLPTDLKRLRQEHPYAVKRSGADSALSLIYDDPTHFLDEVTALQPPW